MYHALKDSTTHKGKVSAYLVEEMVGGVVARIKSLGLVSATSPASDITLALLKEGMSVVGEWQPTKNGTQMKSRAVLGTGFSKPTKEVE